MNRLLSSLSLFLFFTNSLHFHVFSTGICAYFQSRCCKLLLVLLWSAVIYFMHNLALVSVLTKYLYTGLMYFVLSAMTFSSFIEQE